LHQHRRRKIETNKTIVTIRCDLQPRIVVAESAPPDSQNRTESPRR
jgi:hypothetical protein